MKKLLMTAVAALALTTFAENEYQVLYWQVTADSISDFGDAAYANLYATIDNGGTITTFSEARAINTSTEPVWRTGTGFTDGWSGDLSGASFYVELLNGSGQFMAQSESVGYSTLLANGFMSVIYPGSGVPSTATGAQVFGAYSVPEPTSGLLMLLGMAGLALRRRRLVV